MLSCFMFGHKDIYCDIQKEIEVAVAEMYSNYGIREFIVGNYGRFDLSAQRVLKRVKERFPELKAVFLLHYYPSDNSEELPEGFDEILFPSGLELVPKRYAIVKGNEYILSRCDAVICYAKWVGNSKNMLAKAERRGVPIINIECEQLE